MPPRKRLVDDILTGDEIEDIPEIEPLVNGVLDLDSTALMYGPSGIGKSFAAIDLALCVATGTAWHGREARQGPVLYAIGEGLTGVRPRYSAWKAHHGWIGQPDIRWAPRAVNILTPLGLSELLEVVERYNPALTVLDTIARHIPGGDENAFETMSQVVECLDRIRVLTGGCALGVHHSGKDEGAGARGHSSFKGAVDTEINVTRGPTMTATKMKNHADGHIIEAFELREIGPSMVLIPKARRETANDKLMVAALGQLGGVAQYTEWRDAAEAMGVPKGSFDRCRKRLIESLVIEDEGGIHRFV